MYQTFLHDSTFHELLNAIDQEFTHKAKQQGCPDCGGKLHQANYPRSPLGLPAPLRFMYEERYSLCCNTCRHRTTPPSVRFFGRHWYPAPLLVLISALSKGASTRRCAEVKRHFGITVSKSTWRRWCRWWREVFITTPFWQQVKGLLVPTVITHAEQQCLAQQITQSSLSTAIGVVPQAEPSTVPRTIAHTMPRTLLFQFQGKLLEKMHQLLRFLAPLTAGILRAV